MAPPIFVVGTGRCGSTMLSDILGKHPFVLNLSEFFSAITDLATLVPQAFPEEELNASQFWNILSTPHHKMNLMLRYGVLPTDIFPTNIITDPRFRTGIPMIIGIFSSVTRDLGLLFDEMQAFVTCQPPAFIQQHYLRFFLWLQQRFKRKIWVERSGGSLRFIPHLYRTFPDAKFIHIIRDGRDTAISMSRHPAFRMAHLTSQFIDKLGIDPFESNDRSRIGELSNELRYLLPESFHATVFRNYTLPLALYGRAWSDEIVKGLGVLEELPLEQTLTIRYEDILNEPETTIKKLIVFIDSDALDEGWLKNVIPLVKFGRSSWKTLPSEELEKLNNACLPGFAALKEHQICWG